MALSDCPHCWETPCVCGYYYRNYDPDRLSEIVVSIVTHFPQEEAELIIEDALSKVKSRT